MSAGATGSGERAFTTKGSRAGLRAAFHADPQGTAAGDQLFLGVDAGNTKTVALVCDGSGSVIGRARAGCGDIYGHLGEEGAVEQVQRAVWGACSDAGLADPFGAGAPRIGRLAMCLAGIDWASDVAFWQERLGQWFGASMPPCSLRNDGFAALRAGFPDGVGVALTCGTGGAVVGRGPSGIEWSGSMWITHGLGAMHLGSEAIRAGVQAELGLIQPTALSRELPPLFGAASVGELIEWQTMRHSPQRVWPASASRAVLGLAGSDAVARRIVDDQARWYAEYAAACARIIEWPAGEPIPVVLGGSVFGNAVMREATLDALAAELPLADVRETHRAPVEGALIEAFVEGRGVDALTPSVLASLDAGQVDADFLAT